MGLTVLAVLMSLVSVGYYARILVALYIEKPTEAQLREAAERPVVVAPYAGASLLVAGALVLAVGLAQRVVVETFAQRAVREALHLMK